MSRDDLIARACAALANASRPDLTNMTAKVYVALSWEWAADALADAGLLCIPPQQDAERVERVRQAIEDEALTRTGRSLGDVASAHIARAVFCALAGDDS